VLPLAHCEGEENEAKSSQMKTAFKHLLLKIQDVVAIDFHKINHQEWHPSISMWHYLAEGWFQML